MLTSLRIIDEVGFRKAFHRLLVPMVISVLANVGRKTNSAIAPGRDARGRRLEGGAG